MIRRLALLWFRLTGWKVEGQLPPLPKLVVIGAPHTTNWDFVMFLAVMATLGVRASFIGKHSLFKRPFGGLMRRLGGIPVRRDVRESVVEQMAAAYRAADSLVLVVAPEGTRSRSENWKSGFYHIARSAGVPIVPARIDYRKKVVVLGEALTPGDDLASDMQQLRDFYAHGVGKFPDQASPVRLVEEG